MTQLEAIETEKFKSEVKALQARARAIGRNDFADALQAADDVIDPKPEPAPEPAPAPVQPVSPPPSSTAEPELFTKPQIVVKDEPVLVEAAEDAPPPCPHEP